MKKLKQYILIISYLSLVTGMVSCKKQRESNDSQKMIIDSANVETKKENKADLIEKKSFFRDSITKANFNLPKGYKLFEEIQGDLNGDGLVDYVLIIKGADKEKIVVNRFEKEVDRNRRGILIYLTDREKLFLATKNMNCFSSENEDGGVYFPPELSISIENGKLYLHYGHGRYGYWKYTFRYQNSNFELIGFDSSENYGPIVNRETSINFLTKKKLVRENINQKTEESGDEVFQENWENVEINKLYHLSEIKDFGELDVNEQK